jgi:hypothetical protein
MVWESRNVCKGDYGSNRIAVLIRNQPGVATPEVVLPPSGLGIVSPGYFF